DDELGEGLPDGGAGRLVLLGEGPLRRQRAARRKRLDQLHQQLFQLVVLGDTGCLIRVPFTDVAERGPIESVLESAPVPGSAPDLRHGISSRSSSVLPMLCVKTTGGRTCHLRQGRPETCEVGLVQGRAGRQAQARAALRDRRRTEAADAKTVVGAYGRRADG